MKASLIILSFFISISVLAQPTVTVRTAPNKDTLIFLPQNSITLTGTAIRANPGHPILDTTWTKTSGPAATITSPSNRMTTTVTGLVAGNYVFTLTATDKNNSASASLSVKVLPAALPIQLSYFNASRNDQGILLSWQTDMESNNSVFIIQKSTDGSIFHDIATVVSKAKNGNSSTQLTYSYQIFNDGSQADMHYLLLVMAVLAAITAISNLNKTFTCMVLAVACLFLFSCTKSVIVPENAPASSKNAFRLKQVDLDGHTSYSEIKLVN
jgi:hypothetical protein